MIFKGDWLDGEGTPALHNCALVEEYGSGGHVRYRGHNYPNDPRQVWAKLCFGYLGREFQESLSPEQKQAWEDYADQRNWECRDNTAKPLTARQCYVNLNMSAIFAKGAYRMLPPPLPELWPTINQTFDIDQLEGIIKFSFDVVGEPTDWDRETGISFYHVAPWRIATWNHFKYTRLAHTVTPWNPEPASHWDFFFKPTWVSIWRKDDGSWEKWYPHYLSLVIRTWRLGTGKWEWYHWTTTNHDPNWP